LCLTNTVTMEHTLNTEHSSLHRIDRMETAGGETRIMAQLFVTLLFAAIMIGAAHLIANELARPIVNQPNGFDDWLADQLALANGHVMVPVAVSASPDFADTVRPLRNMARV
jgi:hypothetical protein